MFLTVCAALMFLEHALKNYSAHLCKVVTIYEKWAFEKKSNYDRVCAHIDHPHLMDLALNKSSNELPIFSSTQVYFKAENQNDMTGNSYNHLLYRLRKRLACVQ